jgi:hypothetical protein
MANPRPAPAAAIFFLKPPSIHRGLVRRPDMRDSFAGDRRRRPQQEDLTMRFMYIVTSPQPSAPTPPLLEAVGKLADREIKAGRMIDNGGLMPLSTGAQVRIADNKLSVVDGPFVETKEMIGGYAIFELRDKEEAVAMAVEFMQLHKDLMPGWTGTCEVRAFASGH